MSDTSVQVFDNGIGGELRGGVNDDGSIWFAARDVATALGFTNTNDLTRLLDEDEKGTHIVRTPGGDQRLSIITEPGLYHTLNLRRVGSIKDEALRANVKAFQHQVNHEILPARCSVRMRPSSGSEPRWSGLRPGTGRLSQRPDSSTHAWTESAGRASRRSLGCCTSTTAP